MRRISSGKCTPKYTISTARATRLLTVSDTENAFICGAYRESSPSSASLINNVATTGALQLVEQGRLSLDALIAADPGVLAYASRRHPNLNLHLSVQGSATNAAALALYQQRYGIRRAVLPRVLSLAQVRQVAEKSPVPIEVFAFGSLCIMAEGRCHLSSYLTGESPNLCGVCSPAKAVRWQEDAEGLSSRLNGVLIDRYGKDESAGYPTLCKGRFLVNGQRFHALEEPTSLNTLDLIPQLAAIGVTAVKIEGRQRSPAYVEQVTRVWRSALDAYARAPQTYAVQPQWRSALDSLSEGSQTTLGAYHRSWQ